MGYETTSGRDGQGPEWGKIQENKKRKSKKIRIRKGAVNDYLTGDLYIPLHLSAPEYVFFLIHVDGEMLVLALLDRIRPGGDGPHLVKLKKTENERNINQHIFISILKIRFIS